jgi:hypothetical protein
MPKLLANSAKEPAWFIKPHHLESLTQHPNSLRDDFLNTKYFSHFNQAYGKETKEDNKQTAINYIEKQISDLKSLQERQAKTRGISLEHLDDLKHEQRQQARKNFDAFIDD